MKELEDLETTLDLAEENAASGSSIKFHEDSVGSDVEFFDDHQKWVIESFDDL